MEGFLRALLYTLTLFGLIGGAFVYTFGVVVPPGFYGIRQIGFGPTEGYQREALAPGYHWGEPTGYLTSIVLVPSTLQAVHFNRDHQTLSELPSAVDEHWFPAINIETVDKGQILVDLTVLARILPRPELEGEKLVAGGPAELAEQVGLDPQQWINRIRTAAEREVGEQLRRLTNAQFYDPKLREHQGVMNAQVAMNATLQPIGIRVEAVLLRRYTFEVGEVNKAIAEKNLQVQRERLSDFERAFAEVEAELVNLKAQGEAEVSVIRETAPQEAKAIRSDGDLAFTQKEALGNRLVSEAKAYASQLKADIFSEMADSEVFLAKELAPLLGSLRGGVVSDIDPYDLNEWMRKFGLDPKSTPRSTPLVQRAAQKRPVFQSLTAPEAASTPDEGRE